MIAASLKSAPGTEVWGRSVYFRDYMIAASLNCRGSRGARGERRHFRDHIIAASLNYQMPLFYRPEGIFPRSYDRGLIELKQRGPVDRSPRKFPRSYDRGLIELRQHF